MFAKIAAIFLLATACYAANFTLKNNSPDQDVLINVIGSAFPDPFVLKANEEDVVVVPYPWSGRIWGRIDCLSIEDCEQAIPATLAEIFVGPSGTIYDVSVIDGFNIAIAVEPVDGEGDGDRVCERTECTYPILEECPEDLQLKNSTGSVIACVESSTEESWTWFREKCPKAFIASEGDQSSYYCETPDLIITFL